MPDVAAIQETLAWYAGQSTENRTPDGIRIFGEPLVGIAAPDDPLWAALKAPDAVGPDHLSPSEWLPGAGAVVSYFLPFTAAIREANRTEGQPAVEWLYGRYEGEIFNVSMRKMLVELLEEGGYRAVAPALDARFAIRERRSNWSERHAAFIAGLGTFCLSKSIITAAGSAGRFGSVITALVLPPSPRPYQDIYEYCTRCGVCIARCPAGAITAEGKDHAPCEAFVNQTLAIHKPRYGCGKCQTGVPCESGIPG